MKKRNVMLTFGMVILVSTISVTPEMTFATYWPSSHFIDPFLKEQVKVSVSKNDTTPPQVIYSNATPVNQDMYGHVNLTALVTDDTGIDFVNVSIFFPNITKKNETMANIIGSDLYFYNTTYSSPGTYIFQIWGVDLSGNINHDCCPNLFVIRDIIPPSIQSVVVNPLSQESGKGINFSVSVTDNVAVDTVLINISGPANFSTQEMMIRQIGTDMYYITLPFWELGVYTFTVDATDEDGNSNISSLGSFNIIPLVHESHFLEAWNLIAIPIQNNWSAETLGQNITGGTIMSLFEGGTQSFITHIIGTPWDDFPMIAGSGFFVYTTINHTLVVSGTAIYDVSYQIYPSWNTIGWFNPYPTTAESLGENITDCSLIISFNSSTQTFQTHVVGTPWDDFIIEKGRGLFIYTTESSIWHGEG